MKINEKKLLRINFARPWLNVIWAEKGLGILVILCEAIASAFNSLIPLMLAYLFSTRHYEYFLLFCGGWVIIRFIEYIRGWLNSIFQLRIVYSVQYNAHRFFLEIDPIYHAQRASGAILGKINRASRGFEDILDVASTDVLPMVISVCTVMTMLFVQAYWIGIGVFVFFLFLVVAICLTIRKTILPNERAWLRADDSIKSTSTENLAQVYLIRASFASYQLDRKLKEKGIKAFKREQRLWLSYLRMHAFNKIVYILPIAVLGLYLFDQMNKGAMDGAMALGLITTYLRGTRDILKIDKPIMKAIKALTRINDLFDFIRGFGKQTFPVLEKVGELPNPACTEKNNIEVIMEHVSFEYHKEAKIFNDNSMNLVVPCERTNKLYGIIGPSGVGKSTFISLLGGQIKPTKGSIEIDGINIYEVGDRVRKRLIAMQGQVASSMRGTLRYNLLFGLPADSHCYLDEHLIDILVRVGLWSLFEKKGGLDTFIGEGGLNLSGGQRQRLNFASLYLRASFYKPHLILIDEPTSSLDELSEQAITEMILELAQHAITLVIAHRIKTVENAVGLLDFSLMSPETELRFYSQHELLEQSEYYKKLVQGKIRIED